MKLEDLLVWRFKQDPEKVLLYCSSKCITYKDVLENAIKIALSLKHNHTNKHIAILMNNKVEFIYTLFGVLLSGNIVVPLSYGSTKYEIEAAINSIDIDFIITDGDNDQVHQNSINVNELMRKSTNNKDKSYCEDLISKNSVKYANEFEINPNINTAFILTTSGSTGNPKGIMLSHNNIISNAYYHGYHLSFNENTKILVTMPFHFSSAITTQIISSLIYGCQLFIIELPLIPRKILRALEENEIDTIVGVPTFFSQLLKFTDKGYNLTKVRDLIISGAQVTEKLRKMLSTTFCNASVIQTYGLTEASPRVCMMEKTDDYLSCGKPITSVSIKIVDSSLNCRLPNDIGEVLVSGPNVMKGYYNNDTLTTETIIDGWLKTGDLGYLDNNENLNIVGRKKNIIITGGINIYPEEIEALIESSHLVEEVYVKGIIDELYGEVPVAYLKLIENVEAKSVIRSIQQMCKEKLAKYKWPTRYEVVSEIPKTKTGKIIREEHKYGS